MLIVYLYFFRTFEQPQMFLNILDCHFCTLLHVTSACLLSLYWNYSSTHTIPDFVFIAEWFTIQYKRVNQVRTPNGPSKEFNRHACVPATTSKHQQQHNITWMHYTGNKKAAVDFPMEIKSKIRRMYTHKLSLLLYRTSIPSVQNVYRSFLYLLSEKKFKQHSTTLIMSLPMWSVQWGVHPVWCRPVHSMK